MMTRVGIPEKAFFPSLVLIVSWFLAVAHSHDLYVYYPLPAWSLKSYGAAPLRVYLQVLLVLGVILEFLQADRNVKVIA